MPDLTRIVHDPPTHEAGLGLYLHVPFCRVKCTYCDFNTYAGIEDQMAAYVRSVQRELRAWGSLLSRPTLHTVFLGGGTPSFLSPEALEEIHRTILSSFRISASAEITMECNPEDVTRESVTGWLASGVNRVSMGVQTFDDELLSFLGRAHTADQAKRAFRTLREAGVLNQSIDLIHGLPHQTVGQWSETLDAATELDPEHLSLYSLEIEKGTPLAASVAAGACPLPDDDLSADMYDMTRDRLSASGFEQYEISNWSKPGRQSKHNLVYWLNQPFLGVGPGAHSWLAGQRLVNLMSPRRYETIVGEEYLNVGTNPVTAMRSPAGPVEQVEVTTLALDVTETMLLGMRLNEGVSLQRFEARFGVGLDVVFGDELKRLLRRGLVELTDDALRLSEQARLIANGVFAEFIL